MPTPHRLSREFDQWNPEVSSAVVLLRTAATVRAQLRPMLAGALLLGFAIIAYVLTRPTMYTSSGSFLLQATRLPAGVPTLAAQLGLSLPGGDPGQSPAFYAEMIRSRSILAALVDTVFEYRNTAGVMGKIKLADVYRVSDNDSALRRDAAIARLRNAVSVNTSSKSGVVGFAVVAPAPELAQRIAAALLEELNRFNTQRRQSQAAAERKFTERRLREVGTELREAERRWEEFMARNRVANSPQLRFEEQRFSREVDLHRAVYSTMAQAFEQAKIEEVRDTPQITVIQEPEVPARRNSRLLVGKTLVAATLGALVGFLVGFVSDRVRGAMSQMPQEPIRQEPARTDPQLV